MVIFGIIFKGGDFVARSKIQPSMTEQCHVRLSGKALELVDYCGTLYGFTRQDILRAGAMYYCQQLLALQSFQQLCSSAQKLAADDIIDKTKLDEFNAILVKLEHSLGLQ